MISEIINHIPQPILILQDEDVYMRLKPFFSTTSKNKNKKSSPISNLYDLILTKTNTLKWNQLYQFSESTEFTTEDDSTDLIKSLIKDNYVQQLFYYKYDEFHERLVLVNVLVAGTRIKKIWEDLIIASIQCFSKYLFLTTKIDELFLRKIFSVYNQLIEDNPIQSEFQHLPEMESILDFENPNLFDIKHDFFASIFNSLNQNENFIFAKGVGFYYLPNDIAVKLLPIIDNKLDRTIYSKLKKVMPNWENSVRDSINHFFHAKPYYDPNKILLSDYFFSKIGFIVEQVELFEDPGLAWLIDFISNISHKLKLYKTANHDKFSNKRADVIRRMIDVDNDIYSRVLKIKINDEILEGNVIDSLFSDPQILRSGWYENKDYFLIFIKKDLNNIEDLLNIFSSSIIGNEYAIYLEKVLEDYPNLIKSMSKNLYFRNKRIKALFAAISRNYPFYYKFFYFMNWTSLLAGPVQNFKIKQKISQLEKKKKYENQIAKSILDKTDSLFNRIYNYDKHRKLEFFKESVQELKLIYGSDYDADKIQAVCPVLDLSEIELILSKNNSI